MILKMRLYTGIVSATILVACGGGGDGGMQQNPTPTKLAFTGQPGNTAVGVAISPPVTVAVQDASSNVVSGATNSVTMALGNNPGGATLGGTLTTNAVNGVATFSDLTVDAAGNGYALAASSTGLTGATSNAFNVTPPPGPPTQIAIQAGDNQSAAASTAVPIDPAVIVRDANGIPVPGVSVTFAVGLGGGTVNPTTPISTNSGGIATVTSWVLGPTPGTNNNTLTATSAGLTGSPVTFTASATTPTTIITVGNNFFSQQNITIPVNSSVTWVWGTGAITHNVNTSSGSPTIPGTPSGPLSGAGAMFGPVTFTATGVYKYYCSIHAGPTDPATPGFMVGTITVQ